MAFAYRPRHPSGQDSPYLSLGCYTCKKAGRPWRWPAVYPNGQRVGNERHAQDLARQHGASCSSTPARSVAQVLDEYLEATKGRRKAQTAQKDGLLADRLKQFLGLDLLPELTAPFIHDALTLMQEVYPEMGPRSWDKHLGLLRAVCRWAWKVRGYLKADPTDGLPKEHKHPLRRVHLPVEAWPSFLKECEILPYFPGIATVLMTGVRRGEAERVEVADFLLDQRILVIRDEISKTGKRRLLPLAAWLIPILRDALPEDGLAFPYSWDDCQDKVRIILKRVGIRDTTRLGLGLYTLRHGFGTWAVTQFNVFEVQQMMGHKRIETTQKYVHVGELAVSPKCMDEAVSITLESHTKRRSPSR